MARAGRKGQEVEAVLVVHPRTLHWVPAPSRGCRCPVGDEGEWGAAGVPSDEQGKVVFFKKGYKSHQNTTPLCW